MMLAKNHEFRTTEPCSEMKCAKWKIRFDDLIFSLVFVGMFRTRCILVHNYLDFMRSSILYFNDVKSDTDLFRLPRIFSYAEITLQFELFWLCSVFPTPLDQNSPNGRYFAPKIAIPKSRQKSALFTVRVLAEMARNRSFRPKISKILP